MTMPRAFYRQALADGIVTDDDIGRAIDRAPAGSNPPRTVAALKAVLAQAPAVAGGAPAVVATVAEILDRLARGDRQASRTAFMIDEISKFCAGYFDDGQAAWRSPWRALPPYAAWRAQMRHDRNPQMMGIADFSAAVAQMPEDPVEAIIAVVHCLGVPERAVEDYLHRALFDVGGWAAYARYRVWQSELDGRQDDTLVQLLAVRVVWGYALFAERTDAAFTQAWAEAMAIAAQAPAHAGLGDDSELAADLILHEAYEGAYQRTLLGRLRDHIAGGGATAPEPRAVFQAAFCIDVRSEVYRRALETVCPAAQTLGFAGFFGLAMEYVPIGQATGDALCPVLLKPAFAIREGVAGVSAAEDSAIERARRIRRRAAKAWKAFKLSAVSSFTYVEAMGLLFAAKIIGDGAGLTRPAPHPRSEGLSLPTAARAGPRLDPQTHGRPPHRAGRRISAWPSPKASCAACPSQRAGPASFCSPATAPRR